MGMNLVVLNGRIPKFEPNYTKRSKEEGGSFLTWSLSVKRDYKKPDEKFYPEDLIRIKAFGFAADFIMDYFKQGDGLIITGRLQKEDDYTDKEGVSQKGQVYVQVSKADFAESNNRQADDNFGTSASAPKNGGPIGRPAAPNKPAAPNRPAAPSRPGGLKTPPVRRPGA